MDWRQFIPDILLLFGASFFAIGIYLAKPDFSKWRCFGIGVCIALGAKFTYLAASAMSLEVFLQVLRAA